MAYCKYCQQEATQIPVRRIDGVYMLEDYCPSCDVSTFRYEHLE
jgi:hypothetical protein